MQFWVQLLALTLCLGFFEARAESDILVVFRSHDGGTDDKNVTITSNTPDFATLGFDKQGHSYNLHGSVILYEDAYYNAENSSAGVGWLSFAGDGRWVFGRHPVLEVLTSVRFVGSYSNDVHVPTLTLFQKPYFGGLTSEVVFGNKPILDHSDSQSLVNFGLDDWTFYDQYNYNGKGHCVKSNGDPIRSSFHPDEDYLGFSLVGKLSVEQGCWAYHGVPANVTSTKNANDVNDLPFVIKVLNHV